MAASDRSSIPDDRVVEPVGVVEGGMVDIVVQVARFLAALGRAHNQLRHRLRRARGFYRRLAAFGTFYPRIVKCRVSVSAAIEVGK